MRKVINKVLSKFGYEIKKTSYGFKGIPDAELYLPVFSPWIGYGEFKKYWDKPSQHTLVSKDRGYILFVIASQALSLKGDFWECGVYKGGTAMLFADMIADKNGVKPELHLFDTFEGMPETHPEKDLHLNGDFNDTDLHSVQERIGRRDIVRYHAGFIPETFTGMEDSKIAFAHIDVDIYQSVLDCCDFIMARLVSGGFLVFDDYGFASCPGAREAVDLFFKDRPEQPLVLSTGQAVVFNSFSN